ncbi:hypothetical protein WR25_02895 [Diploscapter pachys]|uniref:Uncharacterized protein n=1 Tax=Diploscapter pachys TaxID=2018661 RepID=A0A2A2K242_9BILA|nr:hypothetical protein WR25_02895 [Diploscapter pachys]
MIPSPGRRGLFERRHLARLADRVERAVRHHRRQREAVLRVDRVHDAAVGRRGEDDLAQRVGQDQAVAGQHRAEPDDLRALLLLGVLEPLQLRDPTRLAVRAGEADEAAVVGDDEQPVARDPRRRDAGEILFPQPLAGREIEADHTAALADREDTAVVDHRIGVDVRQARHRRRDRGARQRIAPQDAAVFVAIGVEFAAREAGDDRALAGGRCRDAEHALRFQRAGLRPLHLAVVLIDREDLVVLAQHIDRTIGQRRRAAQRAAGLGAPDFLAVRSVERDHVAQAVGGENAAALDAGTAAEARGAIGIAARDAGAPQLGTRVGGKGMQLGLHIDNIHASWPIDLAALPPGCDQLALAAGAGSVTWMSAIDGSASMPFSDVRIGTRWPTVGVFFGAPLNTPQADKAIRAAMPTEARMVVFIYARPSLSCGGLLRGRGAGGGNDANLGGGCIHPHRSGHLNRALTDRLGHALCAAELAEHLAGKVAAPAVEIGHRDQFARAAEIGVGRDGDRPQPLDHHLRLQRVIFGDGLADQRQVAERLRDAAVGSDRRELGGGSLVLLLRQQDVRFGHLGQRAIAGAAGLRDRRQRLGGGVGLAVAELVVGGLQLFALHARRFGLAVLPVQESAERRESGDDSHDGPAAIAFPEGQQLIAAQFVVDFAKERIVVLRRCRPARRSSLGGIDLLRAGEAARPYLAGIGFGCGGNAAGHVVVALHEARSTFEQAQHVLGDQHLPVALRRCTDADRGTGDLLRDANRDRLHHAFDHDGERTRFGDGDGIADDLLRLRIGPSARAITPQHVHRLWRQADMAHDGNAAFGQEANGGRHRRAAFQLHGRSAGLLQQPRGAFERLFG